MTIIQSLLSWIVYAIAGAFLPQQWAATTAALVAVTVVGRCRTAGQDDAELTIEWTSAVFFVAYAIVAWCTGGSAEVARWAGPVSQLWLAASVGYGLVRRRPFTLPLARREAPPEIHHTTWFYEFNVRLTRAWLVSFTISGLVLLAAVATGHSRTWLSVACIVAAIIAPTLYTRALVRKAGHPHPG